MSDEDKKTLVAGTRRTNTGTTVMSVFPDPTSAARAHPVSRQPVQVLLQVPSTVASPSAAGGYYSGTRPPAQHVARQQPVQGAAHVQSVQSHLQYPYNLAQPPAPAQAPAPQGDWASKRSVDDRTSKKLAIRGSLALAAAAALAIGGLVARGCETEAPEHKKNIPAATAKPKGFTSPPTGSKGQAPKGKDKPSPGQGLKSR